MQRREFLKLGSLFAAAIAIDKTGLSSIVKDIEVNPKVLLYSMEHKKYGIRIYGTGFLKINSTKIDPEKYIPDTFKILEIVDNDSADTRKKYWWDLNNCKGQYVPIDIVKSKKNNEKLLSKLKKGGFYNHENMSKWAKGGAKGINKKRKEEGTLGSHMDSMRKSVTPEGKQKMLDTWKRIIHAPRTENQLKALSDIGKKYGKKNGETYGKKALLSFSKEDKARYSSMGGKIGGKKQMENGTHNFLINSPNKIKVICPDGHITSKPSAPVYCRTRGLDVSKCKVIE